MDVRADKVAIGNAGPTVIEPDQLPGRDAGGFGGFLERFPGSRFIGDRPSLGVA